MHPFTRPNLGVQITFTTGFYESKVANHERTDKNTEDLAISHNKLLIGLISILKKLVMLFQR